MTNDECMTDTYVYACMSDVDLSRTRYIDAVGLERDVPHEEGNLIKPTWEIVLAGGPNAPAWTDAVRGDFLVVAWG